jgi:hypothetical protein
MGIKGTSNNSMSNKSDDHIDRILTQYEVISNRRISQDQMLWQTPTLCFTAQAFLFTIALGNGVRMEARLVSSFLIIVTSILCLQLMSKQRYFEVENSKLLEKIEKENGLLIVHAKDFAIGKPALLSKYRSYKVWMFGMIIFLVVAILLTSYCLYRMVLKTGFISI